MLNRLNHWITQWRDLDPWERSVLASLAWRLPVTWVLLRILGFRKTHQLAEMEVAPHSIARIPAGLETEIFAQRCAQLNVIAAHRGIYRANCLHQSLALCRLLRQYGLKTQLRIGVKQPGQAFQAHAWVELNDEFLGQGPLEYQPFDALKIPSRLKPTNQ